MSQVSIEQTLRAALGHHQAGELAQAEALYRQVLAREPGNAHGLHLMGVLATQVGRHDIAADLIGRAIATNPTNSEYHNNHGEALRQSGRLAQAKQAYERALALNANYGAPCSNLCLLLTATGELDAAIEWGRRAVKLTASSVTAYANLLAALCTAGRFDEAVNVCTQTMHLGAPAAPILADVAGVLDRARRLEQAVAVASRAIEVDPNFVGGHLCRAISLHKLGEFDEAITGYQHVLSLDPKDARTMSNLGHALHNSGRTDRAIAVLRQAIAVDPERADARSNLALPLLARGEFEEGWDLYESRLAVVAPGPAHSQPRWKGQDLSGRTILLYSEQGMGDTIQFVRYVPLIVAKGGRVIVQCEPALKRLLTSVPGITHLAAQGEPLPGFDVQCALASLPVIFRTNLQTIPPPAAGIRADPNLSAAWKQKLSRDGDGLAVGISWAGNPTHLNDRQRSMALADLAPLAELPGMRFYSLQKGPTAEQGKRPPPGMNLIDYTSDLSDFADTAALVDHLDLVISVDTAVIHLAATMGKPVWTMLPLAPDWRWLTERSDTPWYPTMRLFRQTRWRNWTDVVARIREELAKFRRVL